MKKNFGLKLEQNLAVRLFFSVDVRIKNVLAIVKMLKDGLLSPEALVRLTEARVKSALGIKRCQLVKRCKVWEEKFGKLSEDDLNYLRREYGVSAEELRALNCDFSYFIKPMFLPEEVRTHLHANNVPLIQGVPDFNINNIYLSHVSINTSNYEEYYYKKELKSKDDYSSFSTNVRKIKNERNSKELYHVELGFFTYIFSSIHPMISVSVSYAAVVEQNVDIEMGELRGHLNFSVPTKILMQLIQTKVLELIKSIVPKYTIDWDAAVKDYFDFNMVKRDYVDLEEDNLLSDAGDMHEGFYMSDVMEEDSEYVNLMRTLKLDSRCNETLNVLNKELKDLSWKSLPQCKQLYSFCLVPVKIKFPTDCVSGLLDILYILICVEAENVSFTSVDDLKYLSFDFAGKNYKFENLSKEEQKFLLKELMVKSFAETASFFMKIEPNVAFADLLCVGFTEQDYLTYLNLNTSDADPEKLTKAKDYFERIKLLME